MDRSHRSWRRCYRSPCGLARSRSPGSPGRRHRPALRDGHRASRSGRMRMCRASLLSRGSAPKPRRLPVMLPTLGAAARLNGWGVAHGGRTGAGQETPPSPQFWGGSHMSKIYLDIGLTLVLVFCGAASAATIPVNQLSGNFQGTNPSVASTNDGVHFGPYANGGATGGSLYYSGFNGRTLGDISALSYFARYNTDDNTPIGAPYLRIFLNGDANDVIFSPNTQPAPQTDENVDNAYNVVAGTVRYDDDPGNNPDVPWATIQGAHANEVVSGIYVSAGFSAGLNLSVLLTHLGVNA